MANKASIVKDMELRLLMHTVYPLRAGKRGGEVVDTEIRKTPSFRLRFYAALRKGKTSVRTRYPFSNN